MTPEHRAYLDRAYSVDEPDLELPSVELDESRGLRLVVILCAALLVALYVAVRLR